MKNPATNRLTWCLAVALLGCILLLFSACTNGESGSQDEEQLPVYESPYDWDCLVYEDGRFSYMKDWVPASLTGIDVSEHQGAIDWYAVATDGIDFAIIRLGNRGYTEGDTYLDSYFYANLEGARNAGLRVGVYFFSQAINEQEAIEEADIVIRALEGIPIDYPVFFDHEPIDSERGRANHLSDEQLTKNARAFCERIEAAGFVPMLYGNKKVIGRMDSELRDRYGVWFAEYDAMIPNAHFDFIIWQYSSSGSVAGINTRVDMNIHFLYP